MNPHTPDPDAVPGLEPMELVVEGQRFLVTRRAESPGTYNFDWISHSASYGFTIGAGDEWRPDHDELAEEIRSFLARLTLTLAICRTGSHSDPRLETALIRTTTSARFAAARCLIGRRGGPRRPRPDASHHPAGPESPVLSGHVGYGDLPGVGGEASSGLVFFVGNGLLGVTGNHPGTRLLCGPKSGLG
jgi:hypothetical protein